MPGSGGARIGIALGEGNITGVLLNEKGVPPVSLSFPAEEVEVGKERGEPGQGLQEGRLAEGLRALRDALEKNAGRSTVGAGVAVALLPPLADSRMVDLPPMTEAEARAVLQRDAGRYFLGAKKARVVGVARFGRGARRSRDQGVGREGGGASSTLATSAPLDLLEALRSAVEGVGWRLCWTTSGHAAWLAEGLGGGERGMDSRGVVAVTGGAVHVLRLEEGKPVGVRQLPVGDLQSVAGALGEGAGGEVVVLAPREVLQGLTETLTELGFTVRGDSTGCSSAEEVAARRGGSTRLELVPPTLAAERREGARRKTWRLMGMAGVLFLAAALAHLWGSYRELGAIQARRASIRSEVAPLLAVRDSLTALTSQIRSLEELNRDLPVWTRYLVELTAVLPPDTYLTGFFASGDTVEVEAAGAEAGQAIQALRQAGLFQELRLEGLVERQLEEGETVEERFRLRARLPSPNREGGDHERR